MQHLLERIKAGTLWDFHGGIHPPENKHQSSLTPVVDAGLPPQLIIPVRQHAGPAGELLVRVHFAGINPVDWKWQERGVLPWRRASAIAASRTTATSSACCRPRTPPRR